MRKHDLAAAAHVRGSGAYPDIRGCVRFRQMGGGVLVTAEIRGLPGDDGIFAFHIHSGSGGTGEGPFACVGGHYDPADRPRPYHAGDLPPLFGNRGYAYLSVFTNRFTVDEVIGRAVVIHAKPDDFTTQPSGNSGERIACGEIRRRVG